MHFSLSLNGRGRSERYSAQGKDHIQTRQTFPSGSRILGREAPCRRLALDIYQPRKLPRENAAGLWHITTKWLS
jgi:hypothetical protein